MGQNDFINEFSKLYLAVHAMYKRPNDPEANEIVYELFYESVKQFGFEAVKKAFSVHIQSPDNGQWMPKPADIVRIISGTSKDNSHVAWSKVKKSISAVGSYETIVFDDPIIHRVIQDMGGWINLCSTSIEELPFKGNEFKSRYTAYKGQGEIPDYPAKLYGICESENTSKNLLEYIPKPAMVGDPEKAKNVLLIGTNRKSLQITTGPGNELKQLANKSTRRI
jgi:hypothetical protein